MNKVLLLIILLKLGSCSKAPDNSEHAENFKSFMQAVAKVEIDYDQDAQYVIIPTRGCIGCIELGKALMDSSQLLNTTFIYHSANSITHHDQLIAVNDEEKLNQVYLGVDGYKPIVVQVQNGHIQKIFGLTPTEKEGIVSITKFDEEL